MSDFHEIWKWEDAEKRLEFSRQHGEARFSAASQEPAGSSGGDVRVERLVEEIGHLRRLLDAKNLECARLQKEMEKLK